MNSNIVNGRYDMISFNFLISSIFVMFERQTVDIKEDNFDRKMGTYSIAREPLSFPWLFIKKLIF